MHKKVYEHYGYDQDNYIGLNPQKNTFSNNWGNFFIEYRLRYQLSLIQNSSIKDHFNDILNSNHRKIENFLNESTKHPSILHGDLWNGNVIFGSNKVYIIDPAVYYGDREVDLAMTQMFGGFDKNFYDAYKKEYPYSKQYDIKKVIYNLYHYLNHYNLFGNGYLGGCEDGFQLIKTL
jgi:fructosamine-3-kinase